MEPEHCRAAAILNLIEDFAFHTGRRHLRIARADVARAPGVHPFAMHCLERARRGSQLRDSCPDSGATYLTSAPDEVFVRSDNAPQLEIQAFRLVRQAFALASKASLPARKTFPRVQHAPVSDT